MMANVSGVSRFLETVGVQGTQAAAENAPGQNFAAVMRKAGDDTGSPLPQPGSGTATAQTDEEASTALASQSSTQPAQKTNPQAGATQVSRAAYVGGQTQGGGIAGSARLQNTAAVMASQAAALAVSAAPAQGAISGKADAAGLGTASTATPESATVASIAAGPQGTANTAPGKDAGVPLPAAKGNGIASSSASPHPAGASKSVASGASALGTAQAGSKVESKLTAAIAQGTPDVPQTIVDLPAVNTVASTVAAAPAAVALSGQGASVETTNTLQVPLASSADRLAAAPMPAPGAGTIQGAGGKQAASGKSTSATTPGTSSTAASTTAVSGGAPPSSLDASLANTGAQQSAAFLTPAAQAPTETNVSPTAQGSPVSVAGNQVQAALNARMTQGAQASDVGTTVASNQPNAAFQAALGANGSPESASKPGPHARSGVTPAKTTGEAAPAMDTASAQAVPAKAAAPAASTSPVSAVAPTPPSANHAATATPNLKVPQKQAQAAVASPTAHTVAPSAGSPLKTAATAESASATTAAVGTAAGMATQAPLAHGAAAVSAPAGNVASVGGATGAGFGAQETGTSAGGSLPHTTLSSTPTSLEVGVSSGTHGWLKIRAELNDAGQVDASLTGASSAAENKLRGDLPALNSYLQGEKVQMGSLDVRSALHGAAFESGSTFSQAGSGGGSAGSGGSAGTAVSADASAAGGRGQQASQQEANSVPVLNGNGDGDEVLPGRVTGTAGYGNQTELGGSEGSPLAEYGAGGGWLNVRV